MKLSLPETVLLGVTASGPGTPVRLRGLANLREQRWTYPSRRDCLSCHNANARFVLGLNTRQLNGDCDYGGVRENQLRVWSRLGLLDRTLTDAEVAALPRLVSVDDRA